MDLVSVIVPIYNVEQYLSQCIDSILNQTYTNLEIILVDDGSPDSCPQICDEYAAKDARVRVIHKPNGGLSDARNTGIDASTGDWLVFVDSDDYIAPDMIASLYDAVIKHNAQMALCEVVRFSDDPDYRPAVWKKLTSEILTGADVLKRGSFGPVYVVAWNKIYAKQLWNDIRYPLGRIHEDEFVAHHLYGSCNKVVCIPNALYYYRQNPNGIMGQKYNIARLDYFDALDDRFNYYQQNALSEYIASVQYYYICLLLNSYFLFEDNSAARPKLKQFRRKARRYKSAYLRSRKEPITSKIALLIFLYCLPLYKAIWHRND